MKKPDPIKAAAVIYFLFAIYIFVETLARIISLSFNPHYYDISHEVLIRLSIYFSLFTAFTFAVLGFSTYKHKRIAYRLSVVLFVILMFAIIIPLVSLLSNEPVGISLYTLLYLIPVLLVVGNKERMGN